MNTGIAWAKRRTYWRGNRHSGWLAQVMLCASQECKPIEYLSEIN